MNHRYEHLLANLNRLRVISLGDTDIKHAQRLVDRKKATIVSFITDGRTSNMVIKTTN